MKTYTLLTVMVLLSWLALAGCGPSQEESAATVTQIALGVFGTQTAAWVSPTSTPTPTPTDTPTPTVTPTPTDTPTPTLSPTPTPVVITMKADGSGDYETLEEAVREAPEGATIYLEAGEYNVDNGIEVRKPLHLVGAGMAVSIITGEGDEYLMLYNGDGLLTVENLAFRYDGKKSLSMLTVRNGEVAISGCHFSTKAKLTGVLYLISAALLLDNDAKGSVKDSIITNNVVGILVNEDAYLTVNSTTLATNAFGIIFFAQSSGKVQGNILSDNSISGITVGSNADPLIEDNQILANTIGIFYIDEAGGLARKNTISSNSVGIVLLDSANPTLESNLCTNNADSGIDYSDESAGIARNNECAWNKVGIKVSGKADPNLQNNNCHDNTDKDVIDPRKK